MRLYHRAGTGRPPRVAWALEEAEAPYELVWLTPADVASDEHRRRHPLGRVPVLENDEGVLFESAALCLHVADLNPAAGLIPAVGTRERALVYQWSLFAMTELEPTIIETYQFRERDPERARVAIEKFLAAAAAVAAALAGRDYLVDDGFTVADIIVSSVLQIAKHADVELPDRLDEYLARLDARPARARTYAQLT